MGKYYCPHCGGRDHECLRNDLEVLDPVKRGRYLADLYRCLAGGCRRLFAAGFGIELGEEPEKATEKTCKRCGDPLDSTEGPGWCEECWRAMNRETEQSMKRIDYAGPKSKCTCGHSGEGAGAQHVGLQGHGPCTVESCGCVQFTWSGWLPEYEELLDKEKASKHT